MKTFKRLWIPGLVALLVSLWAGSAAAQPEPRISFQTFYEELEPYGRWMQHARYGYVWLPDAGPDFQPYATNGHWVVTEYGNTWVSDYDWGWGPFHYGRWFHDDFYGWTWVPGQEWGPAWVSWRNGGGYYGWAPLGPGMGIRHYDIPVNYWCFVPQRYLVRPQVITYCVPRTRVVYIYRDTRHLNNIHRYQNREYVYGPRRDEIERATRSRVAVYQVDHDTSPGRARVQNRSLSLYRPEVSNSYSERGRSRNLEERRPDYDRHAAGAGSAGSESQRYRQDRSSRMRQGTVAPDRESRSTPAGTPQSQETRTTRQYPSRNTRQADPWINRDNNSPQRMPAAVPASPSNREPAVTAPRLSRDQVRELDKPGSSPQQVTGAPGSGRSSRTYPQAREPLTRPSQGISPQEQIRRREVTTPDQGQQTNRPQRERPAAPYRESQGRGRQ